MAPQYLYYYCSSNVALSILQTQKIWLTDLSQSNDDLEGNWALREYVEKHKNSDRRVKVRTILESHLGDRLPLGMCFSEQNDLLSQWRGYASDGAGFCLQFSFESLKELETQILCSPANSAELRLRKVCYQPLEFVDYNFPKLIFETFGDEFENASYQGGIVGFDSDLGKPIDRVLSHFYEFKNPAFSEEKEWRLLVVGQTGSYNALNFKSAFDRIFPHLEIDLPKNALAGVTLGPKNKTPISTVNALLSSRWGDRNQPSVRRSNASYR